MSCRMYKMVVGDCFVWLNLLVIMVFSLLDYGRMPLTIKLLFIPLFIVLIYEM